MSRPSDLVQGTLDLLLLKILALEPLHGWAVSQRLKQVSGDVLQVRIAGGSPTAVYCLERTENGNQLYRSLDQGAGWTNITANLPPPTLVEVSPGEPATVYAGTDSAGLFTRTFLARTESPRTVPFRR